MKSVFVYGNSEIDQLLVAAMMQIGITVIPTVLENPGPISVGPESDLPTAVVINSPFADEVNRVDTAYIRWLSTYLTHLFSFLKSITIQFIHQKRELAIIFLTTNSSVRHLIPYPISPVRDEAIHALCRSLSIELSSFGVSVVGLCLDPVRELMGGMSEIRFYKKKMGVHGIRKFPIKIAEIAKIIQVLASSDMHPISGNVITVGPGSVIGY